MIERTIKLTIDESTNTGRTLREAYRQIFLITINDDGVEIRRARDPVVTRDKSVDISVGLEPSFTDIRMTVEEV